MFSLTFPLQIFSKLCFQLKDLLKIIRLLLAALSVNGLIIEVVYMFFRAAIAIYLSHKVPRHLAVSRHTSVILSCAFALWCADNKTTMAAL